MKSCCLFILRQSLSLHAKCFSFSIIQFSESLCDLFPPVQHLSTVQIYSSNTYKQK